MRKLAAAVVLGIVQTASVARADDSAPARPRFSISASGGVATNGGAGVNPERIAHPDNPNVFYVLPNNGLATNAAVALNLALRVGTRRWRAGLLADLVLTPPQLTHELLVDLRPMLALDANLRLEDDVRLWLGIAAGPSFRNLDQIVTGFSAFVSLDVAVPLSSHFAIDTIIRGGFDEAVTVATDHPDPLGELALGLTFDL